MTTQPHTLAALMSSLLVTACASPTPERAPPPPEPTPAERALEAHGARLAATPGVVRVLAAGDHVEAIVCAEQVVATLAAEDIGVPIATRVEAGATTASGEPCGCAHAGRYLKVGEAYRQACNTCTCQPGGMRCTLLACEVMIRDRVLFAKASSVLDAEAKTLIAEVARALVGHPELTVRVVGHAHPTERGAERLSEARARVVLAALVAEGVDAKRLTSEAAGVNKPIGQSAEQERAVSFDVTGGTIDGE